MDKMRERRDNLTKHLHTIVASNERIKADKMQQLMLKLQNMQMNGDTNHKHDAFGGFDEK